MIAKLESGAPRAEAPAHARSMIAADIRLEFGTRRFAFLQLLKHAFRGRTAAPIDRAGRSPQRSRTRSRWPWTRFGAAACGTP